MGSHGLIVRVLSLSVIFYLMWSGKSLHASCILPFGMCSLSACRIVGGRMYRIAMVKCLFLFVWILTSCSSVLCVLMFLGCLRG